MSQNGAITYSQLPPDKRWRLRLLLQESWAETYSAELGQQVALKMVDTLASDDVGGLLPNSDETALIAVQDNNIRGCAVSAQRHGVIYLWGFYVLAEFQGQGIGKKLMQRSVSAYNATKVVQLTVLKSSVSALNFYRNVGFEPESEMAFEIVPGHMVPSITMTAPATRLVEVL